MGWVLYEGGGPQITMFEVGVEYMCEVEVEYMV